MIAIKLTKVIQIFYILTITYQIQSYHIFEHL